MSDMFFLKRKKKVRRILRQGLTGLLCVTLVFGLVPSTSWLSIFQTIGTVAEEEAQIEGEISSDLRELLEQPVPTWDEPQINPQSPKYLEMNGLQTFRENPTLTAQSGGGGAYLSVQDSSIDAFSPLGKKDTSIQLEWEDTLQAWIEAQEGEALSPPSGYNVTVFVRDMQSKKNYQIRTNQSNSTGRNEFIWTGIDASGQEVPDGVYEWYLEAESVVVPFSVSEEETKEMTAPSYFSEYRKVTLDREKPEIVAIHDLGNGKIGIEVRDEVSGLSTVQTSSTPSNQELNKNPLHIVLPVDSPSNGILSIIVSDHAGNETEDQVAINQEPAHLGNNPFWPQASGSIAGYPVAINLVSGNGYQRFEGFTQPSIGLDVPVELIYNHQNKHNGMLGYGWSLSIDNQMTLWPNQHVTWKSMDGTEYYFEKEGSSYKTYVGGQEQYDTQLSRNDNQQYIVSYTDQTTHLFSNDGRLLQHRDRYDNFTNYTYDRVQEYHRISYRLGKITTSSAKEIKLTYDPETHQLTSIEGPGTQGSSSRIISFDYSDQGQLSTLTDVMGASTSFTYDDNHRLDQVKNPVGIETNWSYGNGNRVENISMTRASDSVQEFLKVDYFNDNAKVSQPLGEYELGWDNQGRPTYKKQQLTDRTPSEEATTHYLYDRNRLLKETDPLGISSYYQYDERDRLTATRSQSGRILTYQYNNTNDLIEEKGPYGYHIEYQHTYSGKKLTSTKRTEHISDPFDRYNPTTIQTTKSYNSKGLLEFELDGKGERITYTYDANGHLTSDGFDTTYTYDQVGNQLTKTVYAGTPDAETTTYKYNARGQVTETEHPNGLIEKWSYNSLGLLTEHIQYDKTKPSQKKEKTIYQYNEGQHQVKVSTDTRITSYQVDGMGNRIETEEKPVADPSSIVVTKVQYDARGWIIGEEYPSGEKIETSYNLSGQKERIVTQPDSLMTEFTYDEFGRESAIIYPDGSKMEYIYDLWDRPVVSKDYRIVQSPANIPFDWHQTKPDILLSETRYNSSGQVIEFKLPSGSWTRYAYDKNGNLAFETQGGPIPTTEGSLLPTGEADSVYQGHEVLTRLSFAHDKQGRLVKEVDGEGYETFYEYKGPTTTKKIPAFDENGSLVTYQYTSVYDAMGNLIKQISPDVEDIETYQYDVFDKVTLHVNPEGKKLQYVYDQYERLSYTIEDVAADGKTQRIEYAYDAWGNKEKVREQLSESEYTENTYEYNKLEQLVKHISPVGLLTIFEYNEYGELKQEVEHNQTSSGVEIRITKHSYDVFGNKVGTVWPDQSSSYEIYDSTGNRVAEIDQEGYAARFDYNADGMLTSFRQLGKSQRSNSAPISEMNFFYNGRDNLVLYQDPNGNHTRYDYDKEGRMTEERAYGRYLGGPVITQRYSYDPRGLEISYTNGAQRTTTFQYDNKGQLEKEIDPEGIWTLYEYSPAGYLTAERRPLGRDTITFYDLRGKKIYEKDALENQYGFNYDLGGRMLWETNKRGDKISYAYDPDGRMLRKYTANEGLYSYTYDTVGNQLSIDKPVYGMTYYQYDQQDNLIKVDEPSMTGDRLITDYTYDTLGNRLTQRDPNEQLTSYAYDYASRKTNEIMYLNGVAYTFGFSYDPSGNVTHESKPGEQWISYAYDPHHRLSQETHSDGGFVSYTYNGDNTISTETTPDGTTFYAYFKNGQVMSVTSTNGDVISYDYDENGDIRVEYVNGQPRTFDRDGTGQTTTYTDGKGFEYHYKLDPDGIVEEVSLPNGVKTNYVFKPSHLLDKTVTTNAQGEQIYQNQYQHNLRDYVTSVNENGREFSFGYESREQLDRVITPDGEIRLYTYDGAGNRTVRKAIIGGVKEDKGEVIELEDLLTMILEKIKEKEDDEEGKAEGEGKFQEKTNPGKGNKKSTSVEPKVLSASMSTVPTITVAKNDNSGNNGQGSQGSQGKGNENKDNGKSSDKGTENALERGAGKKLGLYKKLGLIDGEGTQKITGQVENILAVLDNIVNGEHNLPPGEHTELFALVREVGQGYTVIGTTWKYNERNEITYKENTIRFEEYDFKHDQAGNMTTDGRSLYEWNAKGQLTKVTFPDGFGQKYEYDAKGRRTKLTQFNHQGSTQWEVNYSYQGNSWQITKETDEQGNTLKEYTYNESGKPMSITFKEETFWYIYNGHGDVVALTDTNGEVAARYEYDEWGNVTKMFNRFEERVREGTGWIGDLNTGNGTPGSRLGPVDDNDDYDYHPGNGRGNGPNKETSVQTTDQTTEENLVTEEAGTEGVEEETVTQDITTDLVKENPYRYAHYYYDRKTQFYYLQARYYNPRIGRFISMDPWRGEITNPLSLNRYVYSYNNPVNYVDPTGYMAWYQPLHLILGIGQSGLDLIVDTLLSGKHMYDFSKALMQGTISFKDILSSVANGFKEPFVYLVNNGKKVWLDKPSSPSNKEVREYGRQLGHSLQIIIGSAALAAVGVKIISKGSKAVGTALQKLAKETGNQKRKPNNYSSNDISNKYAKNDNQGNLYGANNKSTKGKVNLPSSISYSNTQLQKKFKHASDFDIQGNYNTSNATKFKNVLDNHIKSADSVYQSKISGTGDVFVYIKNKNLAVFVDKNGNFVSGWRLNQQQLDFHTLHHGTKIK